MRIHSVGEVSLRAGWSGAVVAVLLLGAGAPVQAQDCPGSTRKGDGADIQCRVDRILEKHEALIGTIKEKVRACAGRNCDILEQHLRKVESAHARARGQQGRMRPDDYEKVNTRRKAKCKGQNCYETPGDFEVGDEEETGTGSDIVDQLDEIGQGIDKTNELLTAPPETPVDVAAFRSFTASATAFPPLYDYTGDPDYPAWLHIGDNPKAIIPTAFAVTIAAQVAEGVRRVTKNVCQQDILGFNGSLACLVTSLLAGALDSTAVLLNYNLTDATAWDTHGAYLRAANLNDNLMTVHGNVAAVGGQVEATQAAIADLEARFADLQQELVAMGERLLVFQNQVIQLLLTPEGQRAVPAAILTCDGSVTPCPTVAVQCSPTTGLCSFK